jgi:CheY-specific phosphatase CheX
MATMLRGKRVLILNDDESPLFGDCSRSLREAGAEVFTALKPPAGLWYVEGEPLDSVLVFLNRKRPGAFQFVHGVRQSRLNKEAPVSVVASELDAGSIKRLASLRVANIILAPAGPDDVVVRVSRTLTPPQKGGSYDVRVINSFLAGARDVLDHYLGPPLDAGKPSLKRGTKAAGFVTGLIAFTIGGQFGSIAVTFERALIERLAVKMLGEDPSGCDDAGYADLAGEMCNQILGKAQTNLEALGTSVQMGLPEVAVGDEHAVQHKVTDPVVALPFACADTRCMVEFAMSPGVSSEIQSGTVAPAESKAVELFQ